jgi:hypothetical protein
MATLALPIHAVYQLTRRIVIGELPFTSVRNLSRDFWLTPRAVMVDTPIPTAGVRAILCYTPGLLRWEHPVDPATTVTVSLDVRKTADYDTINPPAGTLGYRVGGKLPVLRVTRADGYALTDTMADVTDTWDTLTVAMPVLARGVLVIEAHQRGTRGDNGLVNPVRPPDPTAPAPRCWWANLRTVVT